MNNSELKLEAVRLLDIIAAEFSSDLMSVQCFDLRIVDQAKHIAGECRASGIVAEAWRAKE